jgi:membrane protease YdiL (CAAX protease family)
VAADASPLRLDAWAMALLAGVGGAAAILAGRTLARPLIALADGVQPPWSYDLQTLIVDLLVYGALILGASLVALFERRAIWRLGDRPLLAGGGGLALGALGFAASLLVAWLVGAAIRGAAPAPGPSLIAPVLADALLVAFAAGAEELFFRGWIQPVLGARLGAWIGLIVTALLFSALHFAGGLRSPMAAFNIFLAGMLFGLLALRSGGLIAPCAAHFAWNWSETGLFGSDPNPGAGPFGAFLDVDLKGPTLWSGGADTMNGSLAATLVLGAIVLVLVLIGPRWSHDPPGDEPAS